MKRKVGNQEAIFVLGRVGTPPKEAVGKIEENIVDTHCCRTTLPLLQVTNRWFKHFIITICLILCFCLFTRHDTVFFYKKKSCL